MATLKENADITAYNGQGLQLRDFIINSSPHKTENLELLQPDVRMAMEYAIDRNAIAQTAWLGYAKPGSSIVPPGAGVWNDPQVQPLPFDIAKANAILDAAGYARGPDGIRVANGHPMSYTVLFAADESGAGDAAFRIIQNGFQQIGIDVTQRKMDNDAVNTAILGDNNTYNTFDLAMWDWYPCCPVPDFILSVLQCSQFGGWSDTGYCNKTYDKMYDAQQLALDQSEAGEDRLRDAADDRQGSALHRPQLRRSAERLVQRLDRVRRVLARAVQQLVQGELHPGPPGLAASEREETSCTAPSTSSSDSRSR